jgi:hypothetical protein
MDKKQFISRVLHFIQSVFLKAERRCLKRRGIKYARGKHENKNSQSKEYPCKKPENKGSETKTSYYKEPEFKGYQESKGVTCQRKTREQKLSQ